MPTVNENYKLFFKWSLFLTPWRQELGSSMAWKIDITVMRNIFYKNLTVFFKAHIISYLFLKMKSTPPLNKIQNYTSTREILFVISLLAYYEVSIFKC